LEGLRRGIRSLAVRGTNRGEGRFSVGWTVKGYVHILVEVSIDLVCVIVVSVLGSGSRGPCFRCLDGFLGGYFVRGEKATAWAAGATHGVLVPRLVKIWLSLA